MPYEVIEISANSWRIEENGVRSFLFAGEKSALLVDTGFGTGDLKAVVDGLTKLPVKLVNTHADGDHTGCNAQFDVAYLYPTEFEKFAASGKTSPVAPIWEGDNIDLGGRAFEVIHIPGHTPGSIALLDDANKILVGGDSISTTSIFMFGADRSLTAYIASLEKLEGIRNKFDTVYPSHGEFPVRADIIPELLAGAKKLLAGELEGGDPPFPVPAKLYDIGVAGFLY
ncbi:MAG: MBL fold metallo-hydrolase [Oscillospiraceae bacterium]|jgi:glyoxylase-like metal-dependent hydrolase (beta-lactamase superfamily II)|nr:MBL fold metallo-hydrolase [Oscillospiraceae bacterium]